MSTVADLGEFLRRETQAASTMTEPPAPRTAGTPVEGLPDPLGLSRPQPTPA
jgi:hypothetical protein